ncbi:hypothetical protein Tco_0987530 [Tanacetum coccineum]
MSKAILAFNSFFVPKGKITAFDLLGQWLGLGLPSCHWQLGRWFGDLANSAPQRVEFVFNLSPSGGESFKGLPGFDLEGVGCCFKVSPCGLNDKG